MLKVGQPSLEQRRTVLLDWHNATQSFGGLMESWQERPVALSLPITKWPITKWPITKWPITKWPITKWPITKWPMTKWVVERNGAQRYLLQYEHTRR